MKKMDEMELSITLQAIKWSWSYMILILALWMIYEFVQGNSINIPVLLLVSQNMVFFIAQQILTQRAGDDRGRTNLLLWLACTVIFLAAGALLLFFFR
ncbi:DUF6442 family protein [Sinanaerobacter chloroacetimidivorans]|jgi:hypothetical protein|uniref:Uncharacterized protein n=1 Tax=Sinanaerobacter chloroacetimidivorans TaxID=2818044 RepID=A0A8J8B2T8_9FIRM|nr:DUF6442 family protein [Sinanaerobacter chloroacetimidivorans]MBR0599664.1 hypothetical protein [Sinanaerobacter chloroacetimidivorans]